MRRSSWLQIVVIPFSFLAMLALVACEPLTPVPPSSAASAADAMDTPEVAAAAENALVFTPPITGVSDFVAAREPASQFASRLGQAAELPVRAFVPTDYGNALLGIQEGEFDIVYLPAPFFVKAQAEMGVEPGFSVLVDGSPTETGLILVRADNDIQSVADLAGQRIAAANLDSTAGWVAPAAALQAAGVNPLTDVDAHFTGSDVDSIHELLAGEADAAFVRARALEDEALLENTPDVAEQVRTLAEFADMPIGIIAFAPELEDEQVTAIQAALSELGETDAAMLELYGWDGLAPADEIDLSAVQEAAQTLGLITAEQ